jgi:hypothetical protein
METQKMSLANMQGKLSRAEMKNIMAGVNTDDNDGTGTCTMSCGTGSYSVSCSSANGICYSSDSTPKDWIECDGNRYPCC